MKVLIAFTVLIFSSTIAFSTGQEGDIIVWNKKTYSLFSNPLASYPQYDLIRGKLFDDRIGGTSTGCVRGYIAEWQIVNNQIYLTNLFSCNLQLKADLNLIFPGKVKNGKIKADWINGILIVPDGKCIFYGNLGYSSIYETENELTIKRGKLVGVKEYDNSNSHISIFTQKPDSLMKFIDMNIQWNNIPDTINKPIRINLLLITTDSTKPDIRIARGSGFKLYDDEALRVASQIPDWDVYFQRGKVFKQYYSLPIIFTKEKKIKYTH